MIEFFAENRGTIAVAAVLAALVAAIVVRLVRRLRSGKCVGGCECCESEGSCRDDQGA
jgi:hypothetical protein